MRKPTRYLESYSLGGLLAFTDSHRGRLDLDSSGLGGLFRFRGKGGTKRQPAESIICRGALARKYTPSCSEAGSLDT